MLSAAHNTDPDHDWLNFQFNNLQFNPIEGSLDLLARSEPGIAVTAASEGFKTEENETLLEGFVLHQEYVSSTEDALTSPYSPAEDATAGSGSLLPPFVETRLQRHHSLPLIYEIPGTSIPESVFERPTLTAQGGDVMTSSGQPRTPVTPMFKTDTLDEPRTINPLQLLDLENIQLDSLNLPMGKTSFPLFSTPDDSKKRVHTDLLLPTVPTDFDISEPISFRPVLPAVRRTSVSRREGSVLPPRRFSMPLDLSDKGHKRRKSFTYDTKTPFVSVFGETALPEVEEAAPDTDIVTAALVAKSGQNPAEIPDEDKPFPCPKCTKVFKRMEHLKRHVRSVHTKVRPFPCNQCEKKFSRSDNLAQHLKTHKREEAKERTRPSSAGEYEELDLD